MSHPDFRFESEQAEQVDFNYRSRSLLVAILSGGDHAGCKH